MTPKIRQDGWRPATAAVALLVLALVLATYGVVVAVVASNSEISLAMVADFADSYAIVATLFSAGAFLAIAWTLMLQRHQLQELQAQGARAAAMNSLDTNLGLVRLALDDQNLAQVYGLATKPESRSNQQIYVHMLMLHWWTLYAQGIWDDRALVALMDPIMTRSEAVRFYWERDSDRWSSHERHPGIAHGDDAELRVRFARIADQAFEEATSAANR